MSAPRHVKTSLLAAVLAIVGGGAAADSVPTALAAQSPSIMPAASTALATPAAPNPPTISAASVTSPTDYSFCTVCHGAAGNGNPAINAPKIAGIEPWYLKRQLELFRAGHRGTKPTDLPGIEMQPVGAQLDDRAIDTVSAYVATFPAKTPPITVRGNAKRGRDLYLTCSGCHGQKGEGNSELKAPALAGQTDWYLVTQLARFKNGERGFAPDDVQGNQMRAAAAVLPDATAAADLVTYINTLSARRGS